MMWEFHNCFCFFCHKRYTIVANVHVSQLARLVCTDCRNKSQQVRADIGAICHHRFTTGGEK